MTSVMSIIPVLLILPFVLGENGAYQKRILIGDQPLAEVSELQASIQALKTKVSQLESSLSHCNGGMYAIPTCQTLPTSCPDGFLKHWKSCYKFYNQKMSWPEAMTYCHSVGAHLVRTESLEEFEYVRQWLVTIASQFTTLGAYCGGIQGHSKGEWEWVETANRITNISWAPNQPDKTAIEDCLLFYIGDNGYFHDAACDMKVNFVCEIDLAA